MFTQQKVRKFMTLAFALLLALSQAVYGVQQDNQKESKEQQEEAAKQQKKEAEKREKEAKKQQEEAAKQQEEAAKQQKKEAKKREKEAKKQQEEEAKRQEEAAKQQKKEAKKNEEKEEKPEVKKEEKEEKKHEKKEEKAEVKKEPKPEKAPKAEKAPKTETKKEAKIAAMPTGTPVLWKDPGDISSRDLFLGPGGEEMKPNLSSVNYIERETGGFSVKYRVRDGSGKIWVAKVGSEAQPETASNRLVWAMGYVTEINYLYPCVHIQGAPPPQKKVDRCEGDGFANVRFEARPDWATRTTEWEWSNNPFAGTKELKGLIIMMGLLNNWDLKTPNNKIVQVKDESGRTELQYIISDLGATFGKTGGFISHNRNQPDTYAKTSFVKGVKGNNVEFAYSGKSGSLFNNITVEDARWIGQMLARLTDKQIADAFRAANYDQADIQLLTSAVRRKINELVNVQGGSAASTR